MATLTNVQRDLLTLFAHDLPEDDLLALRRVLVHHFADRATQAMDLVADRDGLTEQDFDRWSRDHERAAPNRS